MRNFGAVALALAILAGAGPSAAGPVLFSRLASCPSAHGVVFTAREANQADADTLMVVPASGTLAWLGGPVRGFACGRGDTAYAATLLGVSVLVGKTPVSFLRWETPVTGSLDPDPLRWPALRRAAFLPADKTQPCPSPPPGLRPLTARPAVAMGIASPFPRRYHPLAGNNLLFLVDAENPPRRSLVLQDLHGRDLEGREYVLARNLEVRGWVLGADSLHWALPAQSHRPDYGGQVKEVVLAGAGARVETFELGRVRALAWDDSTRLWAWNERGEVTCIQPAEGAWRVRRIAVAPARESCAPGEPESLWVWTAPGRYADRHAADRFGEEVRRAVAAARTWTVRLEQGAFRPVWGGYCGKETLMREIPRPPVPGARPRRIPVTRVVGTATRHRFPDEGGIAILRQVSRDGEIASELWWRFTGRPREARLAGPWGFRSPRRARSPHRLSVDTPSTAP